MGICFLIISTSFAASSLPLPPLEPCSVQKPRAQSNETTEQQSHKEKNLLVRVALLLGQPPRVDVPLAALQALPARQRRHPVDQQLPHGRDALLLEHAREPLLPALRLGRHERPPARLADQRPLRRRRAADRQQRRGVGLADHAQARVAAARVALPVRVVGEVARGDGHGVVVAQGVEAARRGPAVVRVQGHAVGAVRVDGEGAADALPDADGLEGLFLHTRGGGGGWFGQSILLVGGGMSGRVEGKTHCGDFHDATRGSFRYSLLGGHGVLACSEKALGVIDLVGGDVNSRGTGTNGPVPCLALPYRRHSSSQPMTALVDRDE